MVRSSVFLGLGYSDSYMTLLLATASLMAPWG